MQSRVRPLITGLGMLVVIGSILAWASAQDEGAESIRIEVATNDQLGTFIVDGFGFALFGFSSTADADSQCVGGCLTVWPPVLVGDTVSFGEGIDLGLLGIVWLQDGRKQLTYSGFPLHRRAADGEPGNVSGHGVDGTWFLLSPEGAPLAVPEVASDAQTRVDPEQLRIGAQLFASVCANCHGAQGGGGMGPRLVGNGRLADAADITGKLINGFGYMPPVGSQMSDKELAAVLTFVRTSWGNEFGLVQPEEVQAAR